LNFVENALYAGGPSIGPSVVVPCGKERVDSGIQFIDAAKRATSDGLLFEFGEPTLDQVEPTWAGRGEVKHDARSFPQPVADAFVIMDSAVIQDQVPAKRRRKLCFDAAKQAQNRLVAVARVALSYDVAFANERVLQWLAPWGLVCNVVSIHSETVVAPNMGLRPRLSAISQTHPTPSTNAHRLHSAAVRGCPCRACAICLSLSPPAARRTI
jgi:hypothetical protein